MPERNFLDRGRISPVSLAVVIAVHGAALTALFLARGPVVIPHKWQRIEVVHIPNPPDPEPIPEAEPNREVRPQRQASAIDTPPRLIDLPTDSGQIAYPPLPPLPADPSPPGNSVTADPPAPPAPPVRTQPEIDPRFAAQLQPPYPPAEERAEREGVVRVRVTVGPDGRVKALERLSATSDAFWAATERHARARWRFRPATLDGRPVESTMTITLRFQLPSR